MQQAPSGANVGTIPVLQHSPSARMTTHDHCSNIKHHLNTSSPQRHVNPCSNAFSGSGALNESLLLSAMYITQLTCSHDLDDATTITDPGHALRRPGCRPARVRPPVYFQPKPMPLSKTLLHMPCIATWMHNKAHDQKPTLRTRLILLGCLL
ncbi:hypothetical protein AG1IA_02570 [Rhizoctonia solani AG-1 IA]|uniref:Uncharacterized protein n=1 Tax=Thanatephorus cucumeris (strain AG1-IA) TaxID=983506 RepID=L8WZ82_THACA|nr:hypothetical protein AG1IA_02570 [Rhizoctonia solani AG-1 IA]